MHYAIKLWHYVSSHTALQLKQRSEITIMGPRNPPFFFLMPSYWNAWKGFCFRNSCNGEKHSYWWSTRVLALIFIFVASWLRFWVFHCLWASLKFQGKTWWQTFFGGEGPAKCIAQLIFQKDLVTWFQFAHGKGSLGGISFIPDMSTSNGWSQPLKRNSKLYLRSWVDFKTEMQFLLPNHL